MSRIRFLLPAMLVCAVGCAGAPDDQLVGAWSANSNLTQIPDLPLPNGGKRLRNGILSMQLKLSADHTFVLSGPTEMGGKWSYASGELKLVPSKDQGFLGSVPGMKIRTMKVEPNLSRATIVIPTAIGPLTIVFDKTA